MGICVKVFIIGLKYLKKKVIDEDHIAMGYFILFISFAVPYQFMRWNDLDNYKEYTVGVICKIYIAGKSTESNLYEFYVNGEKYLGTETRGLTKIVVGDSAIIKYDRTNPNNNEIVGYFEYALDRNKLPDTVFYRRQMDRMRKPLKP